MSPLSVPRVLMVTGAYMPELSGGGLQCKAIIDALKDDARFMVLTTSTNADLEAEACVDGTPVFRTCIDVRSAVSRLSAAVSMARVLVRLRNRFDVVHLHGFSQKAMLIVPLARMLGKRVVLTLHTADQDEPLAVRRSGWLAYACYKAADLFIAISPRVAETYRASGLPAVKLWPASNGIDLERFRPATAGERATLRHRLGLDSARVWILFVGFFSRDKGPHLLFEAWKRLPAEERERSGLLFVGATRSGYHEVDPALAESIRADARGHAWSDRVIIRDETARIEEYYQAADILAFPSCREARGMTLVEAMACGLAVVASRLPGATDHVVDGETGLLVPPQDIGALSMALHALLSGQRDAVALGVRARAAVADEFDIHRTAGRMLDAYRHVLRTPGVGAAGLA